MERSLWQMVLEKLDSHKYKINEVRTPLYHMQKLTQNVLKT